MGVQHGVAVVSSVRAFGESSRRPHRDDLAGRGAALRPSRVVVLELRKHGLDDGQ